MLDPNIDTDGTAFICPECSFNGTSLPELISHLNEAHSEGLFINIINHFDCNLYCFFILATFRNCK